MGNTYRNRRNYIAVMLLILTFESGLRGLSVGSDTLNYYDMFNEHMQLSWTEVFNLLYDRYILNLNDLDMGFVAFNKLLSYITSDFSIYLLICAVFFFIPFGRLLLRYTSDFTQLIFIFVLYVSLFNMVAMSGVRKEIALGASIMAFLYYVDKKYILCCLVIFLSTFIHLSTLLFLLIPLLGLLNLDKLRILHLLSFFAVPFVIVFSGPLLIIMGRIVGSEKYAEYGMGEAAGGAVTFTMLMILISLFCFISFWKIHASKSHIISKLYIMLPCFTVLTPLITNNGSMIRISQYYHIYILLLLPYAIDMFTSRNNRKAFYVLLIFALMLLNFKSSGDSLHYKFIWNDNNPVEVAKNRGIGV